MRPLGVLMLAGWLAAAATPAGEAERALSMLIAGRPAQAVALLDSLSSRMPHNGRLRFDLAAALFADSAPAAADSVLGVIPAEHSGPLFPGADTLASASAAAALSSGISSGDYAAVSSAADTLRRLLSQRGDAAGTDAANLESALSWLADHEPPQQEGGGGSSDREDPEEDRQEEGEEPPRERRPEEGDESAAPQEEVPQAPEEMTPEMARRILDMVDEAAEGDSVKARGAGGRLSW
jgi:hypothetical protein